MVCKECFFDSAVWRMAWAHHASASPVSTPRSPSLEQIIKAMMRAICVMCHGPEMGKGAVEKITAVASTAMCVRPLQRPLLKGQAERKQDYQTLQLLQRCSGKKSLRRLFTQLKLTGVFFMLEFREH